MREIHSHRNRDARTAGGPERSGCVPWPAIDFPGVPEEQLFQHGLRGANLLQQALLHRGGADRANPRLTRAVAAIDQLVLVAPQEFGHELRTPRERAVARPGREVAEEVGIVRQPFVAYPARRDPAMRIAVR